MRGGRWQTALVLALLSTPARAQFPPTFSHTVSPEVSGKTVTFRLRAPRARDVMVRGSFAPRPVPMERDAEGVWSVRVEGVEPGLYAYAFLVDGLGITDPMSSESKLGRWNPSSMLQVPGSRTLEEPRDVPRGVVQVCEYRSRVLGQERRVHVYTPPQHGRGGPLPVLYLFHGFSDTDATWFSYGRANVIADNLIAEGRIRPLVVVMPDGHSLMPETGRSTREYSVQNTETFVRELRVDVIPLVESRFRVARGLAARTVLGFAMGADQALAATLGPTPLFGRAGAISPDFVYELPAALGSPPPTWALLRIPHGHPGRPRAEGLANRLRSKRTTVVFQDRDENPELWHTWRADLAELLVRLFGR